VLDGAAKYRNLLWPVFQVTQLLNFVPSFCVEKPGIIKLGQMFCDALPMVCNNIVAGVHFNPKVDDILSDIVRLISHYPAGTASKNIMKYAQSISTRKENQFPKFDYGSAGNLRRYGTEQPAMWDVSQLQVFTVLIAGTADMLGNPTDVAYLSSILPNSHSEVHYLESYDHVSFLFPVDPTEMFGLIDSHMN
jgi:hypothetical protein